MGVGMMAIGYGKTAWEAHQITLALMETLPGTETLVVDGANHPQGLNARITDIQHAAGPISMVLEGLQNVQLEATFWAVGCLRREV